MRLDMDCLALEAYAGGCCGGWGRKSRASGLSRPIASAPAGNNEAPLRRSGARRRRQPRGSGRATAPDTTGDPHGLRHAGRSRRGAW